MFYPLERKIITDWARLKSIVDYHKSQGKIIGLTNGCFDIIHPGHIYSLMEAKSYVDILIVAINSDESIRRIKGFPRPILDWEARATILASLFFVDYVTVFDEDTPVKLIEYLKPHYYFKGGDYDIEKIPEYEAISSIGGKAITLEYIEGYSTSGIIEKILKLYSSLDRT